MTAALLGSVAWYDVEAARVRAAGNPKLNAAGATGVGGAPASYTLPLVNRVHELEAIPFSAPCQSAKESSILVGTEDALVSALSVPIHFPASLFQSLRRILQ